MSNNHNKQYLPKLKGWVNTNAQWQAFTDMLDYHIELHQKKLEQSVEPVNLYQAQGAITALRQLKHLRDEVNAESKTTNKETS
jgi:hypothetical protein